MNNILHGQKLPESLLRNLNGMIDVISAVTGNEVERLLSHLNSVEPSIQFILEFEQDRHLPFLDFNVYRGESISDRPNVNLAPVWKSIKKRSSFAKKKIQLYRSTHA